jgi:2-polyprenyl-3-methyl-5-hydroxy-6-metoxy-1,4-benzoquinol methylase
MITPQENKGANIQIHAREARDFKALHPELFNQTEYDFLKEFERRIALMHASTGQTTLLDLACGTGRLTHFFAEKGYAITACDLSSDMLEKLRSQLDPRAHDTVRLVNSDVDRFLAADQARYDGIVMGAFLHHVLDVKGFLARALTRVMPGGLCLIIHDPARRKKPLIPLGYLIEKFDSVLFQIKYLWKNHAFVPRSQHYRCADVHTFYGIDDAELAAWLDTQGFSIIKHARYYVHKTRLVTFLDKYLLRLLPQFVIIAEKRRS